MKKIKKNRFVAFLVAALICISSFSTVTFAKENEVDVTGGNIVSVEKLSNGKTRTTYEVEVSPESIDESGIATHAVDSSFTMTGTYHRGADRKYSGNYISYQMTVTSSNGGAVDKKVAIQLWDYNHSTYLQEHVVTANGITVMEPQFQITPNRTYYFKYYLRYGSSSNLRIRLVIDTWS